MSQRGYTQLIKKGLAEPTQIPSGIVSRINTNLQARSERYYRWRLLSQGAVASPEHPDATDIAPPPKLRTLGSTEEYESARAEVQSLGLHPHPDDPKNWDSLLALQTILSETDPSATILDAGGARYSPLVEWLFLYGYDDLFVYNIDFPADFNRGPVEYIAGDFTDTAFPSGTFDAITSLSVIEHGLDVRTCLEEFYRLLKSGGTLIISTDYWPEKISTDGKRTEYGESVQNWTIYDKAEIQSLLDVAEEIGFETPADTEYSARERTTTWKGEEFTFVYFELTV